MSVLWKRWKRLTCSIVLIHESKSFILIHESKGFFRHEREGWKSWVAVSAWRKPRFSCLTPRESDRRQKRVIRQRWSRDKGSPRALLAVLAPPERNRIVLVTKWKWLRESGCSEKHSPVNTRLGRSLSGKKKSSKLHIHPLGTTRPGRCSRMNRRNSSGESPPRKKKKKKKKKEKKKTNN